MWLIMRGAMGDWPRRGQLSPLLPRARVQHGASDTSILEPPKPDPQGPMRIALAGAGAFGIKHLDGLSRSTASRSTAIVEPRARAGPGGGRASTARDLRRTDLDEALASDGRRRRDPVHADPDARGAVDRRACGPASTCRWRSRLADSWADAQAVDAVQKETGLVCMVRPHPAVQPVPPVGAPAGSRPASCTSSRWTCRPTSSGAPT